MDGREDLVAARDQVASDRAGAYVSLASDRVTGVVVTSDDGIGVRG
jgi:hypothetical protein